VLESIQAMSLLTIMEVVGPVLLLAILLRDAAMVGVEDAGRHRPSGTHLPDSSIAKETKRKSVKNQLWDPKNPGRAVHTSAATSGTHAAARR
jgi:hypothetical protein